MKKQMSNIKSEMSLARATWGPLSEQNASTLKQLIDRYFLSVSLGDLLYLEGRWYVTHSGLLRLSRRKGCAGIQVRPVSAFCDPSLARWAFKATVYRSRTCRGFVGLRRCGSLERVVPRPRRRDACRRDPRREPCSAQSLWDWHLLA